MKSVISVNYQTEMQKSTLERKAVSVKQYVRAARIKSSAIFFADLASIKVPRHLKFEMHSMTTPDILFLTY